MSQIATWIDALNRMPTPLEGAVWGIVVAGTGWLLFIGVVAGAPRWQEARRRRFLLYWDTGNFPALAIATCPLVLRPLLASWWVSLFFGVYTWLNGGRRILVMVIAWAHLTWQTQVSEPGRKRLADLRQALLEARERRRVWALTPPSLKSAEIGSMPQEIWVAEVRRLLQAAGVNASEDRRAILFAGNVMFLRAFVARPIGEGAIASAACAATAPSQVAAVHPLTSDNQKGQVAIS